MISDLTEMTEVSQDITIFIGRIQSRYAMNEKYIK